MLSLLLDYRLLNLNIVQPFLFLIIYLSQVRHADKPMVIAKTNVHRKVAVFIGGRTRLYLRHWWAQWWKKASSVERYDPSANLSVMGIFLHSVCMCTYIPNEEICFDATCSNNNYNRRSATKFGCVHWTLAACGLVKYRLRWQKSIGAHIVLAKFASQSTRACW